MDTVSDSFSAIKDFVSDLSIVFGSDSKGVALYKHLLDKTTLQNSKPVQKHIDVFKEFIETNMNAIAAKDTKLFNTNVITYSERVMIDIVNILESSSSETSDAVWNHLLTINARINPSESALTLLKESVECSSDKASTDFLQEIVDTVTSSVDPNTGGDPMMIAMGLMSSGKLSSIISNMTTKFNDGTINPNDLLKRVSEMYTDMTANDASAPDISSIISTFSGAPGMTPHSDTDATTEL